MSVGETLRVIATHPGSAKDINAFCQQTGQELVSAREEGSEPRFVCVIRKA